MTKVFILAAYVDSRKKKQFNKLLSFKIYNFNGYIRMLKHILEGADVVRVFYVDGKKLYVLDALKELYYFQHTNRDKVLFLQHYIKHISKFDGFYDELMKEFEIYQTSTSSI